MKDDSIFIDNIVNPPQRVLRHINKAAQELGRLGGKVKSEAKTKAVRENGKLGGRPKKDKKCNCYINHYGKVGIGIENRLDCPIHGNHA